MALSGERVNLWEPTIWETVSGIEASLKLGQGGQDSFYLGYFLLLADTIASAIIPALDCYPLIY